MIYFQKSVIHYALSTLWDIFSFTDLETTELNPYPPSVACIYVPLFNCKTAIKWQNAKLPESKTYPELKTAV